MVVIKTIDQVTEDAAKGVNDQLNKAIDHTSVTADTKAELRKAMNKQPRETVLATEGTAAADLKKFKREVLQKPTVFVEAVRKDIHDKIFAVLAAYRDPNGIDFSSEVTALQPAFAPRPAGSTAPGAAPQTGAVAQEKTLNYDEYMKKNYPNPDDTKGYKAIFATMSYWAYRIGRWFDWSKKNPANNTPPPVPPGGNAAVAGAPAEAANTALELTALPANTTVGSLLNQNIMAASIGVSGRLEVSSDGMIVHVNSSKGPRKYSVISSTTRTQGAPDKTKTSFGLTAVERNLASLATVERKNGKIIVHEPGIPGLKEKVDTEVDERTLLSAIQAADADNTRAEIQITIPYKTTSTGTFGSITVKNPTSTVTLRKLA